MLHICRLFASLTVLTLILAPATALADDEPAPATEEKPAAAKAKPAILIVEPKPSGESDRADAAAPDVIVPPTTISTEQRPRRPQPDARRRGERNNAPIAVMPWPSSPYRSYRWSHVPYPSARAWRDLYRVQRSELHRERMRRFNERDMKQRSEKLVTASKQAVQEGLGQMSTGEYRAALISFTRAADLNQGDPACRIHIAQARMALGHDTEAAEALRRALDLQPKLVNMPLNLERTYLQETDFADQVAALSKRLSESEDASADEYFLLGFMQFQRGDTDSAYAAFRQAARTRPDDELTQQYLTLTKPAKP